MRAPARTGSAFVAIALMLVTGCATPSVTVYEAGTERRHEIDDIDDLDALLGYSEAVRRELGRQEGTRSLGIGVLILGSVLGGGAGVGVSVDQRRSDSLGLVIGFGFLAAATVAVVAGGLMMSTTESDYRAVIETYNAEGPRHPLYAPAIGIARPETPNAPDDAEAPAFQRRTDG